MDRTVSRALAVCLAILGGCAARAVAAPAAPPAPSAAATRSAPATQETIDRVELMPNRPQPFKLKDFKAIARGLDKLLFDFDAKGKYLPLIWWDDTRYNVPMRGFGFPSYVGRPNQTDGMNHESITTMGALLGATIAGIDKSSQPGGNDWVEMAQVYYNVRNGENVVLNNVNGQTGQTYWYETFPQILFNCLIDRYPDTPRGADIMRTAAEQWYKAYQALAARPGGLDFEHTGFNLKTMQAHANGKWVEPDGAEAVAWILFSAYRKFDDEKYLAAAKDLIAHTNGRDTNPHYEISHLYGTYLAARLNAEHDTNYDVGRFVNWCFDPSESRPGWGVAVGRWGAYECSGIAAGVNISGGYGFVMNTYVLGGTLVPLVRYDDRYARAVGKWMLNAMNSVRLCYPDELPPDMQSSPGWQSDPPDVIAYEGLIHVGPNGKKPYAQGDAIKGGWGPSDLGVYGSGFVGMFAAMINPSDQEMIPQLDLLACDFFRDKAYPSYLYYNPHDDRREVSVQVGESRVDLYDAVRNDFVARNVSGSVKVPIPPDAARVLVLCPAGAKQTFQGRKTLVDGVVIDYDNGRGPPRPPATQPVSTDTSKLVNADRAFIKVDGNADDWTKLQSDPIQLDTGGRGKMEVRLRFAWDDVHLYVLAEQTAKAAKVQEASDVAAYAGAPWNFDGVWMYIDLGNGRVSTLGDFVAAFALSSTGAKDLWHGPADRNKIVSVASGSAGAGNRVVEACIAWRAMIDYASNGRAEFARRFGPIAGGFRFGCDPMLVEFDHTSQSYVGGEQYRKPTGRDANSRDVVLRDARR